jgi:hypothetical protein
MDTSESKEEKPEKPGIGERNYFVRILDRAGKLRHQKIGGKFQ